MDDQVFKRMWQGRYSLLYCESKIAVYSQGIATVGGEYRNYAYVSDNGWVSAYAPIEELQGLRGLRTAVFNDPVAARDIVRSTRELCRQQIAHAESLPQADLDQMPAADIADMNDALVALYFRNQVLFTCSQPEMLAGVQEAVEHYVRTVSRSEEHFIDLIGLLTTPTSESMLVREEIDWLRIVGRFAAVQDVRTAVAVGIDELRQSTLLSVRELVEAVEGHIERYGWLPTQELNPAWTVDHFLGEFCTASTRPLAQLAADVARAEARYPALAQRRDQQLGELLPPPEVLFSAALLREMAGLRWELRLARTRADFRATALRNEIARRLDVDPSAVVNLFRGEVGEALRTGSKPDPQMLSDRGIFFVLELRDGAQHLLVGDIARSRATALSGTSRELTNADQVVGRSASYGKVRGRVLVLSTGEATSMKAAQNFGSPMVLVTGQTRPQVIAACRQSAAIITDEGGVASHAAVVARELGVPCIVGTGHATSTFKSGDLVEVDASKYEGVVRRIDPIDVGLTGKFRVGSSVVNSLAQAATMPTAKVGGKARALGRLVMAGFNVPDGFVVPADLNIDELAAASKEIELAASSVPSVRYAVRSSATHEDGASSSFAGMFDSFLNVSGEDIFRRVVDCRDSIYSDRVAAYCGEKSIEVSSVRMAVIVQSMIAATSSGVALSEHFGRKNHARLHVSVCKGIGEPLVSGQVDPDEYELDASTLDVVGAHIGDQRFEEVFLAGDRITRYLEPAEREAPKATRELILAVATLTLEIQSLFGLPVEIEWCSIERDIHVLQARPIVRGIG